MSRFGKHDPLPPMGWFNDFYFRKAFETEGMHRDVISHFLDETRCKSAGIRFPLISPRGCGTYRRRAKGVGLKGVARG